MFLRFKLNFYKKNSSNINFSPGKTTQNKFFKIKIFFFKISQTIHCHNNIPSLSEIPFIGKSITGSFFSLLVLSCMPQLIIDIARRPKRELLKFSFEGTFLSYLAGVWPQKREKSQLGARNLIKILLNLLYICGPTIITYTSLLFFIILLLYTLFWWNDAFSLKVNHTMMRR